MTDPSSALGEVLGVELPAELALQALTHRSYAYEHGGLPDNERLEFLGDAVLGLCDDAVTGLDLRRHHGAHPRGALWALQPAHTAARPLRFFAGAALTLIDDGLDAAQRCEEQQKAMPEYVNAWYLHAYALGRYSQSISVVKALTEGLGGKIRNSLTQAITLEPKHADAHIALGAYHAEVIDKVGSLVGGLTYGAKKHIGVEHFETALKLNPDSAIARIEFANGLAMMFGNCLLYTSPSPRDRTRSRMPSSA